MASNLQGFLVQARLRLDDLHVRIYPEPLLISAANEGKNELVKIIKQAHQNYFEATTSITIPVAAVPLASEVTLPTDFSSLRDIYVTQSGYEDIGFIYRQHSDYQFRQALIAGGSFGSGTGTFFYDIVGDRTLRLAPGSDMALTAEIAYIKMISDMSLPTDAPTGIPSEHWDYIITWMVCEGLRFKQKSNELIIWEAKKEYQKQMIIASVNDRQVREPKFVTGFMDHEEGW
jgi:hypothetical protein